MSDGKKQDIKKLNMLLGSKGLDGAELRAKLTDWYHSSCEAATMMSRNRVFSALLDSMSVDTDMDMDTKLLHELANVMEQAGLNRETSILLIRYQIAMGQLDSARDTYMKLNVADTRKRHAQLLVTAYINAKQWTSALKIYQLMIERYQVPGITGQDLVPFLNKETEVPVDKILDPILGQPVCLGSALDRGLEVTKGTLVTTKWSHSPGEDDPQLLDFTDRQLQELMSNLDTAFKEKGHNRPKVDLDRQYKYIIDGANVLYYAAKQAKRKSDVKITVDSYRRVSRMLKALMKLSSDAQILLVLHERHFDPKGSRYMREGALREIKYWGRLKCVDICRTPRRCNDDYYSLINAFMRPTSLLITNDLFRDHVLKLSSKNHNLDLIAQWRQEKVVEYDMGPRDGPVLLTVPPAFSFRIQRVKNTYYVPIVMDSPALWLAIPAEG